MSFLFKWVDGAAGAIAANIDSTHKAGRVSLRPMELDVRGAYVGAFVTGILPAALAANSEIFQFRYVNVGTIKCILRSVSISAAVSTTAFVAGVPPTLEMRFARSWSGQGTGGTGITWGTNDGKKRTDFATTVLGSGDVRVATTAALGAGTKTFDGTAAATVVGNTAVATATTQIIPPGTILWQRNTSDEYPVLFETQEGFAIRSVQIPGTGTWTATIQVEWAEVDTAVVTGWT